VAGARLADVGVDHSRHAMLDIDLRHRASLLNMCQRRSAVCRGPT
jgi:hypothetical protein